MNHYEDRMEYARDAEGEDNTDPSAPDAPMVQRIVTSCPPLFDKTFVGVYLRDVPEGTHPASDGGFVLSIDGEEVTFGPEYRDQLRGVPTTCPVERVIEALEARTPLDDAIAAGEEPIGPIYDLTDEERF